MVNQPSTGTTWDLAGNNDLDSRFLERGKLVGAAIRDARGADTDISPQNADGSIRWSPFAADGTWRDDMFAFRKTNGIWTLNTDSNEGFHLAGAFKEGDGPSSKPKIDNDDFMIIQNNYPFDSDIVSETLPFTFTGVETAKPLMRRLTNNLPLNDEDGNVLVELPGLLNAGWGKPLDADNIGRQVLLFRQRTISGRKILTASGYALAKLNDIGESKMDKKDSEARDLTFQPLPDGFFMGMQDGEYVPIIKWTWVAGDGWAYLAGLPVLANIAPVATAGSTGKASYVFADPTGPAPFTITSEKSTDAGATWSAATADSPGDVASDGTSTTVKVKSVTAGSTKFRAVVTGSNGLVTRTLASNAVTIS